MERNYQDCQFDRSVCRKVLHSSSESVKNSCGFNACGRRTHKTHGKDKRGNAERISVILFTAVLLMSAGAEAMGDGFIMGEAPAPYGEGLKPLLVESGIVWEMEKVGVRNVGNI